MVGIDVSKTRLDASAGGGEVHPPANDGEGIGAPPDWPTHHVHILEMNSESYSLERSRESAASQASADPEEKWATPSMLYLSAPVTASLCLIYCRQSSRQQYSIPSPQCPNFSTPLTRQGQLIPAVWQRNPALGLVLGVAMLGNMIIAGTVGVGVPLFLRRVGVDPAVASAIVVTTFTDVFGFLLFLGIATAALNLLV